MKTILVTGGAGFIGSNFIKMILKKHSDYVVVNVDSLTYAGNLINLSEIEQNENYIFHKIDIRNREKINNLFEQFDFDYIVNKPLKYIPNIKNPITGIPE